MNRYEELIDLVVREKPRRILEVGTWNGARAVQMCRKASVGPHAHLIELGHECVLEVPAEYVGFDLFETATAETDYVEKNVKRHNSIQEVSALLKQYGIKHTLIRGNTRETLRNFYSEVDFAFIDGGHSVETIASDWFHVKRIVKPGSLVVFDDWYEGVDTEKWGANKVVDPYKPTLSKSADKIMGGGFTRLAWVRV